MHTVYIYYELFILNFKLAMLQDSLCFLFKYVGQNLEL